MPPAFRNGFTKSCSQPLLRSCLVEWYVIEILYPQNALKRDLWEIVKQLKTSLKYATDEIALMADSIYW